MVYFKTQPGHHFMVTAHVRLIATWYFNAGRFNFNNSKQLSQK